MSSSALCQVSFLETLFPDGLMEGVGDLASLQEDAGPRVQQ